MLRKEEFEEWLHDIELSVCGRFEITEQSQHYL